MKETYRLMLLILLAYSSYTDIKRKEIMMIPVYMCFLLAIFGIIIPNAGERCSLFGLIPGILILIISFITKHRVGEGDAYLIMAIGLLTDIQLVTGVMLVSSLLAAAYSLFIIITRHVNRGYTIPFAPFILSGYLGVILFV